MFCEHEAYEKALKIKEERRKKILFAKKMRMKNFLDYYKIADVDVEADSKEGLNGSAKRN